MVLGIDPGSRATGYGVVRGHGQELKCVGAGVIRAATDGTFFQRLDRIYSGVTSIIEEYSPSVCAVEDMFFARNAKSALKLGHARAAAVLAAVHCGLPVYEYTPLQVKKAVVGYGRADKTQVQRMVSLLLGLGSAPASDAADALAVAICHASAVRLAARVSAGGGQRRTGSRAGAL